MPSSAQWRSSTTSDRGGRELVERGGEHVLARARPSSAASSGPPAWRADVAQRAHRARRDQRVARAPEHAPRGQGAADVGDERGLADARLAGHDDDAPGAARVRDRRLEDPPLAVTFEKLHPAASLIDPFAPRAGSPLRSTA